MTRRSPGGAPALAFALWLSLAWLSGCETLRSRHEPAPTRGTESDAPHAAAGPVESESRKILDVGSDNKTAKPFFRSSRLSSGLSDEAREIEKDLGIH